MENKTKYIAYYRVSTKMQGNSGLGLEAQRTTVQKFVGCTNCIIQEFTEIESGKKVNRIELNKAIEAAKQNNCTLIVSKLDRLSRNAAFLFTLRDSGLKILFADMPEANEMQIGIMAVMAQFEQKTISERTKNALAEKKKQGVTLGTPENLTLDARKKGNEVMKEKSENHNKKAAAMANSLRKEGLTLEAIATKLNDLDYRTQRGGLFNKVTISRLLK